jgi:glycosyltransferase involved in cell wall biosynthesis
MTSAEGENVDYSIVVPVFNSQGTLGELVSRTAEVFSRIAGEYEIILVDDCSQDESWQVSSRLSAGDPRIRACRLSQNQGQHAATIEGFRRCRGQYVITLDDDLQHPPEEIPQLIRPLENGYPVVIARYTQKRHSALGNLASALKRAIERWLYGTPGSLYISGFKALRLDLARDIASAHATDPYLPGEIYKRVPVERIKNVDVRHEARAAGRSRYGVWRSLRFLANMIRQARRDRRGLTAEERRFH